MVHGHGSLTHPAHCLDLARGSGSSPAAAVSLQGQVASVGPRRAHEHFEHDLRAAAELSPISN